MANELAVLEGKLPSYLQELGLDDVTKSLMGGGTNSKRISIKGGVFRMMVNGKEVARNEDRSMNIVIVNAAPKVSRTFYAQQYSEGNEVTAPNCWSADGDFPDAKVKNPQSKRCIDCPQNVKGSGQGDNSRACRYSKRVAVVLANDIKGDVYQLTLPATSIFGEGSPGKLPLQAYAQLIGSKGIPISTVVTEMRFDTEVSNPKLTFRALRVLERDEALAAIEQGKTETAVRAITMTVSEADGVTKAPAQPAQIAAPKEVSEPAAVVDEPVKRSARKEEPVDKKDLAQILDEWDD